MSGIEQCPLITSGDQVANFLGQVAVELTRQPSLSPAVVVARGLKTPWPPVPETAARSRQLERELWSWAGVGIGRAVLAVG